jgi:hypothetical protein
MATTKTLRIRGQRFVKRVEYGWSYFQKADGSWWLWNDQKGWVPCSGSAAFRAAMRDGTASFPKAA